MIKNTITFLLFATMGSSVSLFAQHSRERMEAFLTNNSTREWILSKYVKTLGAECKGTGQLYTFFKDGTVTRRRCVNDTIEFRQLRWELVSNSDGDEWIVKFSDALVMSDGKKLKEMRADFILPETQVKGKKMAWREFPGCKLCPHAVLTLTSND